ncbi:MAG: PD40 domain-containing protein [Candidatus Aureabacteria bacterium]|nr:PD40 domain-containing protein [Candidatus Auribacterota bacterium]NLW93663.1 hypothetical protein [Chlamydiota bacterium]HOE26282.1 DPP IV N-terminal domain-containing protein [bacterium]
MKKMLIAAAVSAAAVTGCAEEPAEEARRPKIPSLQGRLVYQRGEGNRSELWLMDLSTRRSVRLTDNDVLDEYPRWSPDGKEIAFYSDRDGTRRLYLMDAAGGNVRRLTGALPVQEDPTWSPDGRRLCFWGRHDAKGPENLYLIRRDGTEMTNLTRSRKGTRRVPAWSPDGSRIAFTSNRYLNHQVYLIGADGAGERRLTGNPRGACRPRWSPDGKRIAYSDGGYGVRKNVDIWEMDPDGERKIRLSKGEGNDYDPAYAPDGRWIIFASDRTGCYELYLMRRDGSDETRLTEFGGYTRYPDWTR